MVNSYTTYKQGHLGAAEYLSLCDLGRQDLGGPIYEGHSSFRGLSEFSELKYCLRFFKPCKYNIFYLCSTVGELLNVEALVFLLEQRMGHTFFNPYRFKIKFSFSFRVPLHHASRYTVYLTFIEYLLCALGKQRRQGKGFTLREFTDTWGRWTGDRQLQ